MAFTPPLPQPQSNTILYASPADVEARLRSLGLTLAALRLPLEQGYSYWAECTKNDPTGFRGMQMWGKTTRHLRDELTAIGWKRRDYRNSPLTVHPERKTAITVVAGNEQTGNADLHHPPTTRYARGAAMRDLFDSAQLELLPDLFKEDALFETWMLLHCVDTSRVRAELSLPLTVDDEGHVLGWRERIMLDMASPTEGGDLGDSGDIDIPVRER